MSYHPANFGGHSHSDSCHLSFWGCHFSKISSFRKVKRGVKLGFSIDSLIFRLFSVSIQCNKTMLLKMKIIMSTEPAANGKMVNIATKIPICDLRSTNSSIV